MEDIEAPPKTRLEKLREWREQLVDARYDGTRSVQFSDRRVEYKSDAEMAAALAALDREIAALTTGQPIRRILVKSSKGLI